MPRCERRLTLYPLYQQQFESVKESSRIFGTVQSHMERFAERLESVTDLIGKLDQSQAQLSETVSLVSTVSEETLAVSMEVSSTVVGQLEVSDRLVLLSGQLEEVSKQLEESLSRFTT